jgi:hypothetical protein
MLHAGIDKHKDNCFIVTVNDEGKVRLVDTHFKAAKVVRIRNCARGRNFEEAQSQTHLTSKPTWFL